MAQMGIYLITQQTTGRQYVGSSVDIAKRFEDHKRRARRGNHHSGLFQQDWDAYGVDTLQCEVLELVEPVTALNAAEKHWIQRLQPVYNTGGPPCRPRVAVRMGVYAITHTATGHRYIGSSKNITTRFGLHRSGLRNGKSRHTYLQAAWTEYGEAAFTFDVLELVTDAVDLPAVEQKWLDALPHTLNRGDYANGTQGVVWSDAVLQARADKARKRAQTPAGKAHHARMEAGRMTPNARQKQAAGVRRYMASATVRTELGAKIKATMATPEVRQRLSEAQLKRFTSDEERRKLSDAHKGIKQRPETVRKRGESAKRHWASEEGQQGLAERTAKAMADGQHFNALLTVDAVREIRRRSDLGETRVALGREFGVHEGTIASIVKRKNWKHVI